jgi:hypothetical protein
VKVDPRDISSSITACVNKVKLIASALDSFGYGTDNKDVEPEALIGLSLVAEELADELEEIDAAYIDESNKSHAAIEALKAKGGAQ